MPARVPESNIYLRDTNTLKNNIRDEKYFYADFAASCQSVVEDIILEICGSTGPSLQTNLVCSGGVFYNSVANGKVLRNLNYKNIHIYPAAGDSGNSVVQPILTFIKIKYSSSSAVKKHLFGPKF